VSTLKSDFSATELQQHVVKQREKRFEDAEALLLQDDHDGELEMQEMKEGDYTVMVSGDGC
jgi:hypothetical protein